MYVNQHTKLQIQLYSVRDIRSNETLLVSVLFIALAYYLSDIRNM